MVRVWGTAASEEESRAYLQTRLAVVWKVMFWAFVALIASQWLLYEVLYPTIKPWGQTYVYVIGTSGLIVMAFIWRGVLLRKKLTISQLNGLDLFYAAGVGLGLGGVALLASDFAPAHYVCMIYGAYAVFTRAILLPSSGWRTVIASTATFTPVIGAAMVLALREDLIAPGPVFFTAAAVLAGIAVLLAAHGSNTIYGLRQDVYAAQQLGQYRLDRKIGEGGMGVVHLAHHTLLRRPTAIKLLLPDRVGVENLARFEREVQHMSRLTHPNTVAVYDYGRSVEGNLYYAMEYLGGGVNLEDLVRKGGPQPAARVVHIMVQVCGALNEAHEEGFIHRDIKPPNIMLCHRGGMPDVVKVVDFGLVKPITTESGQSTQVILGTPAYLAPEVVSGSMGPAVDLYALGAVGYFLLTGQRVFNGKTALELLIQHTTTPPAPPSQVTKNPIPPELEAIVLRCLAKLPADRYASAAELAAALQTVPQLAGWDDAAARLWWRARRDAEAASAAASAMQTETITVDLGERETAA